MTNHEQYNRLATPDDSSRRIDNIEFEQDDDGGWSSKRTVPIDRARAFCASHLGLAADWAPDHDDKSRAWLFVATLEARDDAAAEA